MTDRIAIAYATWDGQTRRIADHIADRLREAGLRPDVFSVDRVDLDFDPRAYARVIVGGAIRINRYRSTLYAFLRRYRDALRDVPVALYTVSGSAASDEPRPKAANRAFAEDLARKTGVRFDAIEAFGGTIAFTRYSPLVRVTMKIIGWITGGPTDTSRDHELTDWAQVDRFADALAGSGRTASEASARR